MVSYTHGKWGDHAPTGDGIPDWVETTDKISRPCGHRLSGDEAGFGALTSVGRCVTCIERADTASVLLRHARLQVCHSARDRAKTIQINRPSVSLLVPRNRRTSQYVGFHFGAPVVLKDRKLWIPLRRGAGIEWDEMAVSKYAMQCAYRCSQPGSIQRRPAIFAPSHGEIYFAVSMCVTTYSPLT